MLNFLDTLRVYVYDCQRNGSHIMPREAALKMIDSLGENARLMLEIGILQDELVKLGFEFELHSKDLNLYKLNSMYHCEKFHHIMFWNDGVFVRDETFYYDTPTWQQDVINKVKELINE